MPRKRKDTLVPVGVKIKKARQLKQIPFENIANETGLAVDYIKSIESGKETPAVGTILQIARALDIDSALLLKEDPSTLKNRIKAYTTRTDDYAYTSLTPKAEKKHLKAFLITIDPLQDHKGVGYQHEGEEFVYVLSGKVEVIVGENINKLKKGETLHFNSGIRHLLKNIGKTKASLLVVLYVP